MTEILKNREFEIHWYGYCKVHKQHSNMYAHREEDNGADNQIGVRCKHCPTAHMPCYTLSELEWHNLVHEMIQYNKKISVENDQESSTTDFTLIVF